MESGTEKGLIDLYVKGMKGKVVMFESGPHLKVCLLLYCI